jgi:hypothetical protein
VEAHPLPRVVHPLSTKERSPLGFDEGRMQEHGTEPLGRKLVSAEVWVFEIHNGRKN